MQVTLRTNPCFRISYWLSRLAHNRLRNIDASLMLKNPAITARCASNEALERLDGLAALSALSVIPVLNQLAPVQKNAPALELTRPGLSYGTAK